MRIKFDMAVVGDVTLEEVVSRIPVGCRYDNGNNQERYEDGTDCGNRYDYVTIGLNNVWGANEGNASITSYEKVGYHAGSADFILGVLAAGCPVYVAWEGSTLYEWRRVVLGM
jgi:hypothetical protein